MSRGMKEVRRVGMLVLRPRRGTQRVILNRVSEGLPDFIVFNWTSKYGKEGIGTRNGLLLYTYFSLCSVRR